ncbi:unnamed protein product [Ceutorhynchus assimilis]|uniref:Helicase ATP-binding domain-containing protein n=1 Tax=Ceutorhynchus assimilis TaxID=467358 RepID=A0A9N9MAU3_9CUCU|nr:unnamed protein product [Ceutorhynchus assimilis]
MEPSVLKRLGDVTIQRLEKPKVEPPPSNPAQVETLKGKDESHEHSDEFYPSDEESGEEYEDPEEQSYELPVSKAVPQQPVSSQDLKRAFPSSLNVGAKTSPKKFKQGPIEKTTIPTTLTKNFELENFSDDEMSYYDSELESEGELQELGGDLGLNMGINDGVKNEGAKQSGNTTNNQSTTNQLFTSPQLLSGLSSDNVGVTGHPSTSSKDEDEDTNGDGASFFEKLVEQAEVPTPTPSMKNESTDEDYEIDIKEKLKEMGEITFASVKKGDKSKNSESGTENEVIITKKSGEEVTVVSKGNLRRNIREVMDETKLDETTLAAQRQEAERLKRVQEQQRILREYQRQAQQERMQQKVMSLLQGNDYSKPGPSNQTRIGNTVLVKLPSGQTKPVTKVQRPPPFADMLRMPKPESPHIRHPYHGHPAMGPMGPMGPLLVGPRGYPRDIRAPFNRRGPGVNLPASLSIGPKSKKRPPMIPPKQHSDSDSENEDKKRLMQHSKMPMPRARKGKSSENQTIEVSSDDDCIVVSESDQDDDEEESDDPGNSGLHTNDEFNQPDEQGRVLVNVGHRQDEPDVFVAPQIARIIKPHQIGGVRFLYDNLIETINRFDVSSGFGCILAHSMGLGKTLQIVTFSDVFLRHTPSKTILCIMPINTLQNWMAEYNMWMPTTENAAKSPLSSHGEVRSRNFNLHVLNDGHKTLVARQRVIHAWKSLGGVLLIGYEQFRLLSMKKNSKPKRKSMAAPESPEDIKNKPIFDEIHAALVDPGPDLIICDEGHRIKNSHASISAALKQVRTKRRVVLTGYPLQNNLTEYWCMVDFVRPNYLGSKTEFLNMFERPIMNGQCIDSTEADIKLMRYRAHVLHSLLAGFVQRRSHRVLQTVLPQKEEYVLLVRLTPFQRQLYDRFMNEVVRKQAVPNPLKAFAVCCKIWNHPDVLYNFLVKKARGDAIDLDLEEVAGTEYLNQLKLKENAVPNQKKPPAKPPKGKPAASVTPYNSNTEASTSSMQPPPLTGHGLPSSQTGTTQSQFANTKTSDTTNYGPYTDEFNQPRTSFEGISQFFDDHVSQSSYDTPFDENAQFTSFSSPNSSFPQNHNINSSNSNFQQPMPTNQNAKTGCLLSDIQSTTSNSQQPPSNQQTSLFNLDSQNTVTVTNTQKSNIPTIPNLPSGISITPLKNPSNTNPPLQKMSSTEGLNNAPIKRDAGNNQYEQNSQMRPANSQFGSQNLNNSNNQTQHGSFGYNQNLTDQNNYWETTRTAEPNPQATLNSPSPFHPNMANTNNMTASQKSESSNDSKPKINIISDIKLPPVRGLFNIIRDIKSEPKKEEDDKYGVKRELEKIKTELKPELKNEDEQKPPAIESPLMKLAALAPLKDSKEDVGIPYDWESLGLGDRLLVFSQSLITLDLIEQFLQMSEIPGDTCKWAKNTSYYRLDGSTGAQEREKLINEFNSNPKIHLFLVSTRAGSLGMSDRVVDECNPDAHLTIKDVSTLCFDDKKEEADIKDWSCCKENYIDVVLQKVLDLHGTTLTKEPFQHESLLVDRKEKQLSQQEKRLAKKGYEREKNATRQPSYLSGVGRGHRPVASVRPMQQGGERPSRWIPAEHWQRQGMTAQEMNLPLDVVIPTNQPEKGNIVLKAGQKVLVLKSPKGVYMQLENGRIVAIKTAMKVKGKAEDNSGGDLMKLANKLPLSASQGKINSAVSVTPQKRPQKSPQMPFIPGTMKCSVKSVQKPDPKLLAKNQSHNKQHQKMGKWNPEMKPLKDSEPMPGSSSEDEHPPAPPSFDTNRLQPSIDNGADELEKKISQLKKNISIQRETLDSITAGFKNPENMEELEDSDEEEDEDDTPPSHMEDDIEDEEAEGVMSESSRDPNKQTEGIENEVEQEASDQSDEVTYVSEQTTEQYPSQPGATQKDGSGDFSGSGYSYNYNYNVASYQGPPPPQGYGYPSQPPPFDGYTGTHYGQPQPPYNYAYQAYPPPQAHYPPQPGFEYTTQPPHYPPNYPYQQYPPPPQGMYPPIPNPNVPPANFQEYTQYPNQQSSTNYYQST